MSGTSKKIIAVLTNVGAYPGRPEWKTGLWLSELTHFYHLAREAGHEVLLASPQGGEVPVDPESLKPLFLDKLSKQYRDDEDFQTALLQTASLEDLDADDFNGIFLTGGHGTVFDFPDNLVLQKLIAGLDAQQKMVAAVCHGVGGLLNVRKTDGSWLLAGREVCGFSNLEEKIARKTRVMPFELETELQRRGAVYRKALLPFAVKTVRQGNLITGQNPSSSRQIAEAAVGFLNHAA